MVVSLPFLCVADEQGVSPEAARRLEQIKSSEDIIEFHGLVVDQNGQPVDGAAVTLSVGQATLLPKAPLEIRVMSDSRGAFEIDPKKDAIRGAMIYVAGIEKDGYEFLSKGQSRGFDYRKNNPNRHEPNKGGPIVFHMRKKGESVFLLQEMYLDLETRINDSGRVSGYDFIRRHRIKGMTDLIYDGDPLFPDLQVKAMFNTNGATWTAILSPGNTSGGILVSEHLFYEAPDTGYQPEYTFTPEDRKPVKAKYVYLKSRDPAIFTRFEIEHVSANKDFFRLSGKSVTNPYGDRNLEQATDLPYEVTKQLTDETKASFRQNKRPSKHELPKLVKEAQERANKGKP